MIILAVSIFTLVIFPIFLNIKIVYNKEFNKIFYLLEIFGFIKILSGYGQLLFNKFVLHISDTKAILFEFVDLDGIKKSFKPFMDYHIVSLNTLTELGNENNDLTSLSSAFILNYFTSIIEWGIFNKKPYLNISNNFNVYCGQSKFAFYAKGLIIFNLLMIIISIFKILLEKVIYEFRKS